MQVVFGKTNLPRFEGYYWWPGPWRGHVREYVKDDLIKLAGYLNLEIVELHSCHHMLRLLPFLIRSLYIGLTVLFPGWRDSWLLVGKKRSEWKPRKFLSEAESKRIFQKSTTYQY